MILHELSLAIYEKDKAATPEVGSDNLPSVCVLDNTGSKISEYLSAETVAFAGRRFRSAQRTCTVAAFLQAD